MTNIDNISYNSDHLHFLKTDNCTETCIEIINDISCYIEDSKSSNNNALAAINFKEFDCFDDYFGTMISKKRRAEYRKAINNGFYTRYLTVEERNNRRDELFAINTSSEIRQGGVMKEEFVKYPDYIKIENNCPFHYQAIFGVFNNEGKWIGYIKPRFCGEIVRTYKLLGHSGFFNRSNFMQLLMLDFIKDIFENHNDIKWLFYHFMYVGTEGLQDWKKNMGFIPTIFNGEIKL